MRSPGFRLRTTYGLPRRDCTTATITTSTTMRLCVLSGSSPHQVLRWVSNDVLELKFSVLLAVRSGVLTGSGTWHRPAEGAAPSRAEPRSPQPCTHVAPCAAFCTPGVLFGVATDAAAYPFGWENEQHLMAFHMTRPGKAGSKRLLGTRFVAEPDGMMEAMCSTPGQQPCKWVLERVNSELALIDRWSAQLANFFGTGLRSEAGRIWGSVEAWPSAAHLPQPIRRCAVPATSLTVGPAKPICPCHTDACKVAYTHGAGCTVHCSQVPTGTALTFSRGTLCSAGVSAR